MLIYAKRKKIILYKKMNNTKLQCQGCNKILSSLQSLNRHHKRYKTDLKNETLYTCATNFNCPGCNKKYASKQSLDRHKKQVYIMDEDGKHYYTCIIIKENIPEPGSCQEPGACQEPEIIDYACKRCCKKFKSQRSLLNHLNTEFICEISNDSEFNDYRIDPNLAIRLTKYFNNSNNKDWSFKKLLDAPRPSNRLANPDILSSIRKLHNLFQCNKSLLKSSLERINKGEFDYNSRDINIILNNNDTSLRSYEHSKQGFTNLYYQNKKLADVIKILITNKNKAVKINKKLAVIPEKKIIDSKKLTAEETDYHNIVNAYQYKKTDDTANEYRKTDLYKNRVVAFIKHFKDVNNQIKDLGDAIILPNETKQEREQLAIFEQYQNSINDAIKSETDHFKKAIYSFVDNYDRFDEYFIKGMYDNLKNAVNRHKFKAEAYYRKNGKPADFNRYIKNVNSIMSKIDLLSNPVQF